MEEELEPCIVIKPEIDSSDLVIVKEEFNEEEYEETETFEEEIGEIQEDSQLLEEKKSKRSRKSISIGDKIEICEKKKNGTTGEEWKIKFIPILIIFLFCLKSSRAQQDLWNRSLNNF